MITLYGHDLSGNTYKVRLFLTLLNIDYQYQFVDLMKKAGLILQQLDEHLRDRAWLELDRPTIADVAVFPYVALAPDGKIALDGYPHILGWIDRIKSLPNFVAMAGLTASSPA